MPETKDAKLPKPVEIIRTDLGITLRQFTVYEAKEIFDLIDENREFLSQHGEDTPSKYQSLRDVVRSILNPPNPDRLRFAIRNKQRTYLGTINLTPTKEDPKKGEIGYYLGRKFTGNGYMVKAIDALSDYAFKNWGYKELFAKVNPTNIRSIKVLEKTGFQKTGTEAEKLVFTKTSGLT